jgi:hypothetical protein
MIADEDFSITAKDEHRDESYKTYDGFFPAER